MKEKILQICGNFVSGEIRGLRLTDCVSLYKPLKLSVFGEILQLKLIANVLIERTPRQITSDKHK